MDKFRFALENALKYRKTLENREVELLVKAVQKVQAEEKIAEALKTAKQNHLKSFVSHTNNLTNIHQYETYMDSLELRITKQLKRLAKAEKSSDMQRTRVQQAASNRRILERLKEKQLDEYKQLLFREEQNVLDEVAVVGYCRKTEDYKSEGR